MSGKQGAGYTPGQYGCAFPFLVITALIIVGVVVTGGEIISWLLP
jgi:hypothetical protein